MSVEASINMTGVKEALRELNDIDKRARRQITKDYQEIVSPITTYAKSHVPAEAPLSGFNRTWIPNGSTSPVLPFSPSEGRTPRKPTQREMNYKGGRAQYREWAKWKAGINAYISGKRPQTFGGYTRNLAAFGVRWLGNTAVLFDTSAQAKTAQGARMVSALNSRFGQPSRVMWRAYEASDREVQWRLRQLVERIMRETNRKI